MNFDTAFERVIGHEGGFQTDPMDRGNWTSGRVGQGELRGTKFGISAMSYPDRDIAGMSLSEAKDIYFEDFWIRVAGDKLHGAVAYQLFDAAVNHGVGNAIRILQRAVGVADDGDMGPRTHNAIKSLSTDDLLVRFNAHRIKFFIKLSTFKRYGVGWMDRVADNMLYSADDYTAPWHEQLAAERKKGMQA